MPANRMSLKIDGDDTVMEKVVSLEYTEAIDSLDTVSVRIVLDENDAEIMATLQPGKPFIVELYEDTAVTTEGAGDVIEVSYQRRRGGGFQVQVFGLDALHRLGHGAPAPTLWEASHDQIVKDIASANKLTGKCDGVSTTEGFEFQANVSDALFIQQLAKKYNYYARVVGEDLIFARREGSATVTVSFEESVIECKLNASLQGMVTKVTVMGSDYLTDEVFTFDAAAADLTGLSGTSYVGAAMAKSAFGEIPVVVNQSGANTLTEVTAIAESKLGERADRFVQGTLVVAGNPAAVAGSSLTVSDGPWPFKGTFLIRQTRHVFDVGVGYRTYIDFVSNSLPDEE